jgi:hypothetical protein
MTPTSSNGSNQRPARHTEDVREDPAPRLSVRLPPAVRTRVGEVAEIQGISLNSAVVDALVSYVASKGLLSAEPPSDPGARLQSWSTTNEGVRAIDSLYDELDRLAAQGRLDQKRPDGERLDQLKRVMVETTSGEWTVAFDDHDRSRHLGKAAKVAADVRETKLARILWQASLEVEPANTVSAFALGENFFDYEEKNYALARPLLRRAPLTKVWLHLKGSWCDWYLATSGSAASAAAADALQETLIGMSYENQSAEDRGPWLDHARRLLREVVDPVERATVTAVLLEAVAKNRPSWDPITARELAT